MRTLRSIAILLVVVAASLLPATAALAHAALVAAEPADGSVLPVAPPALVLRFTEPVTPLVVTLVSAGGEGQSLDAVAGNQQVSVSLPAGLGRGTHLVSWRVTSADGHPVAGALVFSIGEPGARPDAMAGSDGLRSGAIWLVRAALYAALFLAAGSAVFGTVVAALPPRLARLPLFAGVAGLALAPLALGLQGLDALGLGLAGLVSPAVWSTALATRYGASVIAAMAACLAAALSVLGPAGWRRTLLVLVAWLAAALAPMLSGHAGTAPPAWLSKLAVFVHIAGLVFWVGALLPLAALLRHDDTAALARFSRLVPAAVAAVVGSGLVLAVLQMGPPGPAWPSPYAALLAAKLVLLAPLFGLALWNRAALTRPALAGEAVARRRLQRSISIEFVLVLAIFGVVAGWRFTPPPRVIAELAAQPAQTHIHTAAAMADITVTPGRAGQSGMRIWLSDGEFAPLVPKTVTVALSSPALGIERLLRPATLGSDGFWQLPLLLPAGGRWTVELDLRIDDFTLVKLAGELDLAS